MSEETQLAANQATVLGKTRADTGVITDNISAVRAIVDDSQVGQPQTSEGILDTQWFTPTEIQTMVQQHYIADALTFFRPDTESRSFKLKEKQRSNN